jgi:hypothetical protein
VLPVAANIVPRSRLSHDGRTYDVVEVVPAKTPKKVHHQVAICEIAV